MSDNVWTLERIKQLVHNKIQENLHLEYKACADLMGNVNIPELTKDVSAFANADGGTLIFGVSEGHKENKHVPERIDEGFERGGKVNSIWLEDVLLGNIAPKIQGLKPYEIELENGNFILVLEVPQSQYGPHMAKDNRYYKRRQTKAEPMEHYEVEDVRNRSRGPLLKVTVDFDHLEHVPGGIRRKPFKAGQQFNLNIQAENLVEKPAEYAAITFYLDEEVCAQSGDRISGAEFHKRKQVYSNDIGLDFEDGPVLFQVHHAAIGMPHSSPIWQGNPVSLVGVRFQIPEIRRPFNKYYFGWEITAPYMKKQTQFCWVNLRLEGPDYISVYGVSEI